MLHIFTLLACVLTAHAVRFNESDLVIELEDMHVRHNLESDHNVRIQTLPVHFVTEKAWGFQARINVTSDQLNNLKWTLQTDVLHNGTFINDGSGESEKKELVEMCRTAVWGELVLSGSAGFACLPSPGVYNIIAAHIDFTRFFPEDRELFHGEKMRYLLRFYYGDTQASRVVTTLAVRTQNEVDEDNKRVKKG